MEKEKYNTFDLEIRKGNCFEIMNISIIYIWRFKNDITYQLSKDKILLTTMFYSKHMDTFIV